MGHSSLYRGKRRKYSIERHTLAMRVEEVRKPCVELALDSIGRHFGEQGGILDCIKSMRYVQREGCDLMSDIEGLHPLIGESMQIDMHLR